MHLHQRARFGLLVPTRLLLVGRDEPAPVVAVGAKRCEPGSLPASERPKVSITKSAW